MDFVRNRVFRQTLMVHREVSLNRNLTWRNMQEVHFASPARPVNEKPDIHSAATEQFRMPTGVTLATAAPIVKSAMTVLAAQWPETMSFSDLCLTARSRLETGPTARPDAAAAERDREQLGADLLQCFASAMVEVRAAPSRFTREISVCPRANALARLEAAKGARVTTLRHEMVNLDEFNRHVLRHLDGQHDRPALVEMLAVVLRDGPLNIQQEGRPVTDPTVIRTILTATLDATLKQFAQAALLEA